MSHIFKFYKVVLAGALVLSSLSLFAQSDDEQIWIDVRTAKEFNQGHLESSVNIPFDQIQQQISDITQDKNASIHLYCTAGVRAEIAKATLEKLGYETVINEGGLKDLQ